ncbi:hypothetical protein HanHA300_Chr01g0028981 [Helianthus annuus]|nr:hypothetical protein HanHA300_Chr01g0028981 [Helianthus annuus]KAJ0784214.1 hypothetical protein HanLR1_Chr01g0029701 [Helianthus annuus]
MQASASVFGETEHDIAEESSIEDVNLNRVENTKMGLSTDGQPARKQKLVFIRKRKRQTVDDIKNDSTPGKDEDTEEDAACSDKKRTRIVIDLNNPRVGPRSDDDNKSSFANSNKTDSLAPLANGQLQSIGNTESQCVDMLIEGLSKSRIQDLRTSIGMSKVDAERECETSNINSVWVG